MLIFNRKKGEAFRVGDIVRIEVVSIRDKQVKIGIESPREVKVHREEIWLKIREQENAENRRAENSAENGVERGAEEKR